jgi:histidyl-tRNA synthetase
MSDKINYSTPSGFPEFLPAEKRLEQYLMDTIRQVYESYGFTPIETPAVERLEVLQAKGNQGDNIIYGLQPILPPNRQLEKDRAGGAEEKDGESRALKFDQTVPLAAYVARHLNDLQFPFARYQMDYVFRGERPKDGRFRQLRQCDIDVVGREKLSLLYDAQMPAIIAEIFGRINIGDFVIRINNRKVLTGFFRSFGLSDDRIKPCIQIVDNLEKIGTEKTIAALIKLGLADDRAKQTIEFINIKGDPDRMLTDLTDLSTRLADAELFKLGIEELRTVIDGVRSLGVAADRYCIDLSIARGLDYYTGTVYETTLIGHEALGSICSGGRYEELVGMFLGEKMPGVGISIGLTRLISRLLKANILQVLPATPAQAIVFNLQDDLIPTYLKVSQQLRQAGINTVTVFDRKPLKKQFNFAEKQGIKFCIIIGTEEAENDRAIVKNLATKTETILPLGELANAISIDLAN